MLESDLLRHIFAASQATSDRFPHILAGPGHDCAAVATPGGEVLLLKVDQLISGRHFAPDTPVDLIARKSIARAVSDIAACAGRPQAALAAAILPPDYAHARELYDALAQWAEHWHCPLAGGDTATWGEGDPARGTLTLSITVIGSPHPTRGPVLRSTARPGDHIYVTGDLGGSLDADGRGHHLTFTPRLDEAKYLADTLGDNLHAMMDISDGLGRDAARMAAASSARFELDAATFPFRAGIADWRRAAADGEDYELLFTAPVTAHVPSEVPSLKTRITRIGHVTRGAGCIITAEGKAYEAAEMGWDHGR